MHLWSRFPVMIAVLAPLAGCGTTVPVVVITEQGQILRGVNSARLAEDSFQVSDGRLTCDGNYNPLKGGQTAFFLVHCSDGREGFGSASHDDGGKSGSGVIQMDDGTAAAFIFGKAAPVTPVPADQSQNKLTL